ncbi:MAG: AAA family ATPase [Clostridia bacterium]|nr:AAA family ATPase [Clostridia bacterium]
MSIIGNIEQRANLSKVIKNKNVGHAYMFVGIEGVGKSLIAKDFAKAILCLNSTETYCNECECCNIFESSPDFVYITDDDGAIKVGQIRELSENIILKPVKSNRRVFIINNAETMNEAAQNALLKILEEPPAYATIILIVSNKEKILRTIKSRCTEINFIPLTINELKEFYKDESLNEEIYKYARGSIGKIEKIKSTNYIENVIELEKALSYNDLLEMNKALSKLKENKEVKENINDILDLLIIKINSNLKEDYLKKIKQIEIIEECRRNLKRNSNFDITLDCMMVKLWENK